MRDDWKHVRLGDVAELDIEAVPVTSGASYPAIGVLNKGRGIFRKEDDVFAATQYKVLHRVRPGQLIMSKLKAFEGAIAVVPPEITEAYVSPEFPTFRLGAAVLPQYMRLICQQPAFWETLQGLSKGMGGRRERVHPQSLLTVKLPLPPPNAQRRIVDLVESVETATAAASRAIGAAERTLSALGESLLASAPRRKLSTLVRDIEAGKSFRAEPRPPRAAERGILKVSAVQALQFAPAESKAVPADVQVDARWEVHEGDVLITRANTPDRVGAVCRVPHVRPELFLCDKTLRLKINGDEVDPAYFVFAMQSRRVRDQIRSAAGGTSASMANISQRDILALEVPVIEDMERQTKCASILQAQRDVVVGYRDEASRLRALRDLIRADLLTGRHQLPDTYDVMLS